MSFTEVDELKLKYLRSIAVSLKLMRGEIREDLQEIKDVLETEEELDDEELDEGEEEPEEAGEEGEKEAGEDGTTR